MSMKIQAENRITHTKSELKQLRNKGFVPGSISSRENPAISIMIDEKQLMQLVNRHSHEIVEIELPKLGHQSVVLKEVQRDKITPNKLLHVDFHQINLNEPIRTLVRLEIIGEALGMKEGGMRQVVMNEIEVKALPKHLPASIQVDISHLAIGEKIVVGDIQMPIGVECLSEATAVVATVLHVQKVSEEAEMEMIEEAEGDGLKDKSGVKIETT
ncbi:MAG: 50S ribosomal protein L25 [Paenibacillaceae bacterium]